MTNQIKQKDIKQMIDCNFQPKLEEVLKELEITRNALAVEGKVRPVTVNEIASGKVKQVNFATMQKIIETLNYFSKEKGIHKKYSVSDIFDHIEA